jgi:hypothetical protein
VIKKWTITEFPSPQCRADCYTLLDRFYNPVFQRRAIDRAVAGKSADDLFWMKETPECRIPSAECGSPLQMPRSALAMAQSETGAL